MLVTVAAVVDERGNVRLLEEIQLSAQHRALVIILDEATSVLDEVTLLSEPALAEDWNRPEEDAAWDYLV